ncbi:ROK family protein [Streptomyces sp. NPDC059740]|uniref:ROK family transcriptional regulator n=1 Tax=Streptomyces sp. NPDC059740 TaxID=3346926 RepID=UPI003659DC53
MPAVTHQSALRQLRQSNVARVLGELRTHGPRSRADLAALTGLSRTTLSGIVSRLLHDGVLVEEAGPRTEAGGRGRPTQLLALNPRSAQAVGIEVGRERIKVVIADAAHEVKAVGGAHRPARADARAGAALAVEVVRDLARDEGIDLSAVTGVGVGTPGPGETTRRAVSAQAAAPDGPVVPRHRQLVADTVAELLQVPVLADNNSRLAALAEAIWGAARGTGEVLYVSLSYGVGGGLVTGGRLFRGARGAAAEIGHIAVDPDGPRCWCGGHGCMELTASVPALLRASGRRSWDRLRQALDAGEERACAAVERASRAVGLALAAACNTVNPQRVVLGGEVAGLGPAFLGPVAAVFRHHTPGRVHSGTALLPAALGDRGGALGGLALVLQESPLLAGYTAPVTPGADAAPDDDPLAPAHARNAQ